MSEYWRDKRINQKHVVCAWALVLVMLAGMLAVTYSIAPRCVPGQDVEAAGCAQGTAMRQIGAQR